MRFLPPEPAAGAYSASPDDLAGFRGREWKGVGVKKEWKRRGRKGRERKGKGNGI